LTEQTPDRTEVIEEAIEVDDEPAVTTETDPDAATTHVEDGGNPDELAGEEVDDDDLDDDEAEDDPAGGC
jgi:hypothetical protein